MADEKGYVHNLSPTKQSKRKNGPKYFNFDLQTDKSNYTRAVCFEPSLRQTLGNYQSSSTPVKLQNVQRKQSLNNPSVTDIIVTKRSRIEEAGNNDIAFETASPPMDAESPLVNAEGVKTLDHGQLVSIKGQLTLKPDKTKTIQNNGRSIRVLNDAAITDQTGNSSL